MRDIRPIKALYGCTDTYASFRLQAQALIYSRDLHHTQASIYSRDLNLHSVVRPILDHL